MFKKQPLGNVRPRADPFDALIQHHKRQFQLMNIWMIISTCAFALLFASAIYGLKQDTSAYANTAPVSETAVDRPWTTVDWEYWEKVNKDVIGWINIPGTNIDFPIAKAPMEDPDYYLSHNIYKEVDISGAIYLDADCEQGLFDSVHVVLLGHNNSNGTMFEQISNYSDLDWASSHKKIYVQDREKVVLYELGSCKVIPGNEPLKRTSFVSREDLDIWFQEYTKDSCVVLEEYPHNKILTLCTCSYTQYSNERTLAVAYPIKVFEQEAQKRSEEQG